jgi:hypothetical protein
VRFYVLAKPIGVKINVACLTGALNAAVPREAESAGSGGLEDPRQRPTVPTMAPETPTTLPSPKPARSLLNSNRPIGRLESRAHMGKVVIEIDSLEGNWPNGRGTTRHDNG